MIQFEFVPLNVSSTLTTTAENTASLQKEIPVMERERGWFTTSGSTGMKEVLSGKADVLGSQSASAIEAVLKLGGTVAELGAGKLKAARDLATTYSNGHVIAIEPYTDPDTLKNLPPTLHVIQKSLEDLSSVDVADNSVDAAFSGYVFMYPTDKLKFLQGAWRILKPDGHAFIQFFGTPTNPSLSDLITKFNMSDILTVTILPSGYLLDMKKIPNRNLDFGTYTLTTNQLDGATTTTNYTFS